MPPDAFDSETVSERYSSEEMAAFERAREMVKAGKGDLAIATLRKLPKLQIQKLQEALFYEWTVEDPRAAMQFIGELVSPSQRLMHFSTAIGQLLGKDAKVSEVKELIVANSKANERLELEAELVNQLRICITTNRGSWATEDILNVYDEIPYGRFRNAAAEHVAQALYHVDRS